MSTITFDNGRIAYSVKELADITGVSAQTIRDQINGNHMSARYVGVKALVAPQEAQRWFDALPSERR
jgi:DeoR/GlpR family transcriptional regulator of sugar metabolism